MKIRRYLSILPLGGLLFHAGCSRTPEEHIRGSALGTGYTVTYQASRPVDPFVIKQKIEDALEEITEQVSNWNPSSEVARFNASPGPFSMTISQHFVELLHLASQLSRTTEGALDPTMGALIDAWGFGVNRSQRVPVDSRIQQAMTQSGLRNLVLDSRSATLSKQNDCAVNLSALAKGYAVDVIAGILDQAQIEHYLINIGGEIRAKGTRSGKVWEVGIPSPGGGPEDLLATVKLQDQAMATSGTHRKFFQANGTDYSHIIDPRTGRTVNNALVSVSIVAPDCAVADGLATAILVLGRDAGLRLVESVPEAEGLFAAKEESGELEVVLSSGWPSDSTGSDSR